jgi:hypothetical protein
MTNMQPNSAAISQSTSSKSSFQDLIPIFMKAPENFYHEDFITIVAQRVGQILQKMLLISL